MSSRRWLKRALVAAVAGALVSPVPALASADLRSLGHPQADIPYLHTSGLEPGTTLAGFVLPMDWSGRPDLCGPTGGVQPPEESLAAYPHLCPRDEGTEVLRLQWLLATRMLYRSELTGIYDEATRQAVVAFHKLIGPAHTDPYTAVEGWLADPPPNDWSESDWMMLEAFEPVPPKHRPGQPDRIEVDIGHQVLYLIEDHQVAAIMPVSTGKGYGTVGCRDDSCGANVTPRTTRMVDGAQFNYAHEYWGGWSPRPRSWSVYKGIFYVGQYGEWNYGIHGYSSVPSYPASHGCIRVTNWDMDFLRPYEVVGGVVDETKYAEDARVFVGMPIHVWDA
jgi:N-acetylmuramoyl-L-alanine amidase